MRTAWSTLIVLVLLAPFGRVGITAAPADADAITAPRASSAGAHRVAAAMARRPLDTARLVFNPRHWSQRTVILLVMQSLDSAMRLKPVKKKFGKGVRLQTEQDPERPNPTFIQAAEDATKWFAEKTGGIPQVSFGESLFNIPTTAHILGGAVVGQ